MNRRPPKLGIIAPMKREAACIAQENMALGRARPMGENRFLHCSGIGLASAERAARELIEHHGVDSLVSWGVAGALDETLAAGTIVLPVTVIDEAGNRRYRTDPIWHAALKDRLPHARADADLISTQNAKTGRQQKTALHRATGAIAVDMESAAIARVATEAGKPFVVIRSISDTAAMALPKSARGAIDPYGRVSTPKILRGLLRYPGELADYPSLIRAVAKAEEALRRAVALCGRDLRHPRISPSD